MHKLEKYNYLTTKFGVCGGRTIIANTRIEPCHIANYGTMKEIAEDFDLNEEEIREAINYYLENK